MGAIERHEAMGKGISSEAAKEIRRLYPLIYKSVYLLIRCTPGFERQG